MQADSVHAHPPSTAKALSNVLVSLALKEYNSPWKDIPPVLSSGKSSILEALSPVIEVKRESEREPSRKEIKEQ